MSYDIFELADGSKIVVDKKRGHAIPLKDLEPLHYSKAKNPLPMSAPTIKKKTLYTLGAVAIAGVVLAFASNKNKLSVKYVRTFQDSGATLDVFKVTIKYKGIEDSLEPEFTRSWNFPKGHGTAFIFENTGVFAPNQKADMLYYKEGNQYFAALDLLENDVFKERLLVTNFTKEMEKALSNS